ncbi:hypothetical protein SAMN05444320_11399 [Streptoalloteichus hindustanus]|uniref:Uncharacterized protein n=1 Tax=Streptoalloteichus hindustanus TaxID=2017 RepID=A0A1M5MF13_STRHI|nr:hypothetical protein SAMN05444320_11399 [Streptoalloteichus hindustanus]
MLVWCQLHELLGTNACVAQDLHVGPFPERGFLHRLSGTGPRRSAGRGPAPPGTEGRPGGAGRCGPPIRLQERPLWVNTPFSGAARAAARSRKPVQRSSTRATSVDSSGWRWRTRSAIRSHRQQKSSASVDPRRRVLAHAHRLTPLVVDLRRDVEVPLMGRDLLDLAPERGSRRGGRCRERRRGAGLEEPDRPGARVRAGRVHRVRQHGKDGAARSEPPRRETDGGDQTRRPPPSSVDSRCWPLLPVLLEARKLAVPRDVRLDVAGLDDVELPRQIRRNLSEDLPNRPRMPAKPGSQRAPPRLTSGRRRRGGLRLRHALGDQARLKSCVRQWWRGSAHPDTRTEPRSSRYCLRHRATSSCRTPTCRSPMTRGRR